VTLAAGDPVAAIGALERGRRRRIIPRRLVPVRVAAILSRRSVTVPVATPRTRLSRGWRPPNRDL
jgi:hypothetical protein